jgi:hypothetical protein
LPPISSASRETFDNIAEVAARNALAADERAARIFADGLKKDLAEEAAIKKGELAGKARLALINDAIKHKISQKVIDDVCEEVVPAKVLDVMDKGNLSVIDDEVLKNINFEDSKFIREKISNIEKKMNIILASDAPTNEKLVELTKLKSENAILIKKLNFISNKSADAIIEGAKNLITVREAELEAKIRELESTRRVLTFAKDMAEEYLQEKELNFHQVDKIDIIEEYKSRKILDNVESSVIDVKKKVDKDQL